MDGGAWYAAVHGVAKSWTWLSYFTFTFHFHALEKETATHSSVLAWRIPGTGEPGGLQSMGSHRVGHNWSDLAAAAAAGDSWGRQEPDTTERLDWTELNWTETRYDFALYSDCQGDSIILLYINQKTCLEEGWIPVYNIHIVCCAMLCWTLNFQRNSKIGVCLKETS